MLCNRSSAQIVTIAKMFEEDTGTSLLAALEGELSGDFKDSVLALVKGQARVDAEVLFDALTGVGTDEERLNEILTGRHPGQVEDIKAEYLQLGDNAEKQQTLWDAVCADTEFKYERFLKSMLDRAGFLAFLCYEAMFGSKYDITHLSGLGTKDKLLFRVLLSVNRDNDGVKQVLSEYDDAFDVGWKEDLERLAHLPDIEDIKCAYPRLDALGFGCNAGDDETKAAAVENWERVNNGYRGSNPYERDGTFYWCAKEGKDGWVEVPLDEAQKVWKVGTNFFVLDVATKESLGYSGWEEYTVPTTQKVWKVPMGKTLSDAVRGDMTATLGDGDQDFKDMLLWLLKDKDVGAAEAIHDALEGLQSPGHASFAKDSIIGIMASRSSPMRAEIAIKYERLYGNAEFKRGRGMKLSKLKEDITENLEGEFGEVCRDMFQDGDERGADYCFLAMHGNNKDEELKAKGIAIDGGKQDNAAESVFRSGMIGSMGTDEDRLNRIILFSNRVSARASFAGFCASHQKLLRRPSSRA